MQDSRETVTAPDRRLTALLSADVAGYTRLMGEDDRATLETLSSYRESFFKTVGQFGGRIVNAPGDAILAEFGSVVYAVDCALAIQDELGARNDELPRSRRMDFRIGISLGDVLVRDGELYGDGVNLAARVMALAEPGGVCITSKVYYEIEARLSRLCVSLGKRKLKNVLSPVVVFRVQHEPAPDAGLLGHLRLWAARQSRPALLAAAGLAVLVITSFTAWRMLPQVSPGLNIGLPGMGLPVPEGPSLAVPPFENLSGSDQFDWLSQGLTDTLITDLANLHGLFVIAHNSVERYKGQPADVRQIGRELGVRHVLKGSVQRAGEFVRISVQLMNTESAQSVWAQRFDVPPDDVFRVQDDIANKVLLELDVELVAGEQARIWRASTSSMEAYNLYIQGLAAHEKYTKDDLVRARQLYERALAIDSKFAIALVGLGWVHQDNADQGWADDPPESRRMAEHYVRQAIDADETLGDAHALLGNILAGEGQHGLAMVEYERALALNPNSAENLILVGWGFSQHGRAREGLGLVEKGMRLDPYHPDWYWGAHGEALRFLGRLDEAEESYTRCLDNLNDLIWCHAGMVIVKAEQGYTIEARRHANEILRLKPGFLAEKNFYEAQIGPPEDRERAIRAFKAAGLR